ELEVTGPKAGILPRVGCEWKTKFRSSRVLSSYRRHTAAFRTPVEQRTTFLRRGPQVIVTEFAAAQPNALTKTSASAEQEAKAGNRPDTGRKCDKPARDGTIVIIFCRPGAVRFLGRKPNWTPSKRPFPS